MTTDQMLSVLELVNITMDDDTLTATTIYNIWKHTHGISFEDIPHERLEGKRKEDYSLVMMTYRMECYE